MAKSNIEKLLELKQLYEQGFLNKEEMESEKLKILKEQKGSAPLENEKQNDEQNKAGSIFKNRIVLSSLLIIFIVGMIGWIYLSYNQKNTSVSIEMKNERDSLFLVCSGDYMNEIFFLRFKGNDVNGYYRRVGNPEMDSISGTIDNENWLIFDVFPKEGKVNHYEGKLDVNCFNGTVYTNFYKSGLPYKAIISTANEVRKLDTEAMELKSLEIELQKWIDNYGKVAVQSDGSIIKGYLSKDYLATIDKWNDSGVGEYWNIWLYNVGSVIGIRKFELISINNVTKISAEANVILTYHEYTEEENEWNSDVRVMELILENGKWVIDDIDNSKADMIKFIKKYERKDYQ